MRPPYFHQIGVLPQCSPFEGEPIISVIYLYGLLPVCLSAALIKPNFFGSLYALLFAWKLWQKNWVYSGTCGIPCRTHNFTKCRWQGARKGGLMAPCCELLWTKTKACRISPVMVLSLGNNLASSSDENCQLLYKVPSTKDRSVSAILTKLM